MDYDNWLQKGAGCFDDYPDIRECWQSVGSNMWDEFSSYKNIQEFLQESIFGVDRLAELWDEEIEKEEYETNPQYLVDIWTLSEKYPEYANNFFNKVKPKSEEELYNFLSDDEIFDYYNRYWSRD